MSEYPSNSTAAVFYDQEGNPTTLYRLVRSEPDWAESRIRVGLEDAKKVVTQQAEIERLNKIVAQIGRALDRVLRDIKDGK
jgi:hypothetical protein